MAITPPPPPPSEDLSDKKKKRKKKDFEETTQPKLLLNDKVEVRSTEEGFAGSWHSATIIDYRDSERLVKYDHLLEDDGSKELTEWIEVSPVIEGIVKTGERFTDYRGLIRPIPPLVRNYCQFGLHYGLCVDALVNDGWWEGVVFDYDHDNFERLVFFPDLGDQQMVKVENLRITQDWDEVKESWKLRGNWLFLELLEEYEKEWPILVSVRQIWYELRGLEGFNDTIKEWTCNVREMWGDYVLDTLCQNVDLTAEHVLNVILSDEVKKLDKNPTKKIRSKRKYERKSELILPSEVDSSHKDGKDQFVLALSAKPVGNFCPEHEEGSLLPRRKRRKIQDSNQVVNQMEVDKTLLTNKNGFSHNEVSLPNFTLSACCNSNRKNFVVRKTAENISDSADGNGNGSVSMFDGFDRSTFRSDPTSTEKRDHKNNMPSGVDEVQSGRFVEHARNGVHMEDSTIYKKSIGGLSHPDCIWKVVPQEAEYLPQALEKILVEKKGSRGKIQIHARKHLAYLGWKIEFKKDNKGRYRYTSPEGKHYYSLITLSNSLRKTAIKDQKSCSGDRYRYLIQSNSSPEQLPLSKIIEQDEACDSPHYGEHLDLGIPDREVAPVVPPPDGFIIEPEDCFQAIIKFYEFRRQKKKVKNVTKCLSREDTKYLFEKAREHLLALGWKISKYGDQYKYKSPEKRSYCSLLQACQVCLGGKRLTQSTGVPECSFTGLKLPSPVTCTKVMKSTVPSNKQHTEGDIESPTSSLSKEILKASNVVVRGVREHWKRQKKKRKTFEFQSVNSCPARALRSKKRARKVLVPSPGHHTPRTIVSWLIENNMILPRARVRYSRNKEDRAIKEGKVSRDGIKCICCQKVYSLSSFATHAGDTYGRPSARIFLEDGRSLLDCQKQVHQNALKGSMPDPCEKTKSSLIHKEDYMCSVCHYGGTLVLCEQCPSAFHLGCLGLEDVPEGNWFCPSCRCGVCGQNELVGESKQLSEKKVLSCDQCNHEYHEECISKRGLVKLRSYLGRNRWFCSRKCEKIFVGLHKLLGKSVPIGVDNLSWTILKSPKDVSCEFDIDATTEYQSKLNVALGVLHECFEPIQEPGSKRDLVRDVLFNNRSELNRLDFWGFYTVLLEREDELISVAAVRVHSAKVAEVPLVGTCVQYRRQGRCRILFDAIEKKLRELGVERLLLPAVPQVLHTWTTSFGFSEMTKSERLEFLEYTFLDFQGTTMCQKILTLIPEAKSTEQGGNRSKLLNGIHLSKENIDINRQSFSSEVIQTEEAEDSQIVEHQQLCVAVENCPDSIENAPKLNGKTHEESNKCSFIGTAEPEQNQKHNMCSVGGSKEARQAEMNLVLGGPDEKQQGERSCSVKYYRRRGMYKPS